MRSRARPADRLGGLHAPGARIERDEKRVHASKGAPAQMFEARLPVDDDGLSRRRDEPDGLPLANSQTPLTYAMARTLAQFEDPGSVFNAAEGSNVSQCVNSFLILFTDGARQQRVVIGTPTATRQPHTSPR